MKVKIIKKDIVRFTSSLKDKGAIIEIEQSDNINAKISPELTIKELVVLRDSINKFLKEYGNNKA